MKVRILRLADNKLIDSEIKESSGIVLPSVMEGWRFNFRKHAKKPAFETYVLTCDESPTIVEGCLTFQMKDAVEPYMAFIEIAPHNKGKFKRFDKVAGCLIAFACRLSFTKGEGHFKGWLAFDVLERHKDDEIKLMAVYCEKYGALRYGETSMVIPPETAENLINKFLN